jgi:hypothetical protein
MLKMALTMLYTTLHLMAGAQVPNTPLQQNKNAPEIFASGFMDIINNGQVNASARVIRLFIGEPGKWVVPLSVYSGVSANNFQMGAVLRTNEQLVNNFINPLSGLANISAEGILYFKPKSIKRTKAGIIYQFGERVLTAFKTGAGNNVQMGSPVNFLNSYAAPGLYFQTGAWERNNAKNTGITWLALRWVACYSRKKTVQEFLPGMETNGFYQGYSIAWGVEINNLANLKILFYKYTSAPEAKYSPPIYQFSFQYALKN